MSHLSFTRFIFKLHLDEIFDNDFVFILYFTFSNRLDLFSSSHFEANLNEYNSCLTWNDLKSVMQTTQQENTQIKSVLSKRTRTNVTK